MLEWHCAGRPREGDFVLMCGELLVLLRDGLEMST